MKNKKQTREERNKLIRKMRESGKTHKEIGLKFHLSSQAISLITIDIKIERKMREYTCRFCKKIYTRHTYKSKKFNTAYCSDECNKAIRARWSFSYERCLECGTTEKKHRLSGLCERCWYSKNKEKQSRYQKAWRDRNLERAREYCKVYSKKYYKKNKERILKSAKEYRRKKKENSSNF